MYVYGISKEHGQDSTIPILAQNTSNVKLNQSRYRPGMAQRVTGS